MSFENRFIFFPEKGGRYDLNYGYPVRFVTLEASDGVRLHGAFCPVERARGTILWCHGNSGNLTYGFDVVRNLHKLGVSVFLFDYRGYGKSDGSPNGKGVMLDAEAAYAYVTDKLHLEPSRLVLLGESL